ncbi:MAG: SHOCT domain-containing protein [Nitrospirota bacterium]
MDVLAVADKIHPHAQGGWGGWGMGPGMMGGYGMGYGGWLWGILMVAFWVAVIVGIIFLIRWLAVSSRGQERPAPTEDSAMEILRRRYANGEIGKEEFEERKRLLKP